MEQSVSQLRSRAVEGLRVGDSFTVSRCFTQADIDAFAQLSRDYNPVHLEPRFAQGKGLDGLICHGLLVGALVTEIGGQLGLLASGMDFRFRRPVYIGDRVECVMQVTDIDAQGRLSARVEMHNQQGEPVIEAQLQARLPGQQDRRVMAAMLAEGDPTNGVGSDQCLSHSGSS